MISDMPQLPQGWEYLSLESLCNEGSVTYGIVQPGEETEDGVPIVRVNNFRGNRLDLTEVMKVSPEVASKYERTKLKGGEVLLTVVGSVGQVAIAHKEISGYNVARAVAVLHSNGTVSAEWIALALQSPFSKHRLGSRANTTVQTTINLKDLRALPIPVPPIAIRNAITKLIGTIDERIELIRECNGTLEAIAQAIFKSWFIRFDPVVAKSEGRVPEGIDNDLAAIFPDSFVDSEFGQIPTGWDVEALDSVADFLNGLALQKYPATDDDYLPVIKIAQLRKGDTEGADLATRNIKEQYVIKDGDVLFSWSGSLEVEIWCGGEGALNQHLFKVSSTHYEKWFYYLWTKHHLKSFRSIAASKATTMGHIQRSHLSAAKVIVPTKDILDRANEILNPLFERIVNSTLQAHALSNLRSTILPRLISGQLNVDDELKTIEA